MRPFDPAVEAKLDTLDLLADEAKRAAAKMRKLRLHFADGRVVTEPVQRTARRNGITVAQARDRIASWIIAGDLVRRPDGGYDVIRWRK